MEQRCVEKEQKLKFIYLSITNKCNYKCKYCPRNNEVDRISELPYNKIKEYIEERCKNNKINGVVLSGGEPTMHKEFFEILEYLNSKKLYVTILSNGSMLCNENFINKIKEIFDISKLDIVMTIYDIDKRIHDEGTGIEGSFDKTLEAFKLLIDNNIRVVLKHCISKQNYKRLWEFFRYFDNLLPLNIPFQLTSLDFNGMNKKQLKENKFTYKEVRRYLNQALKHLNKKRLLHIVNTPLCASDKEYWKYYVLKQKKAYDGYKSVGSEKKCINYDCDCFSEICKSCSVKDICPGVYLTNYKYIGDDLVEKIQIR